MRTVRGMLSFFVLLAGLALACRGGAPAAQSTLQPIPTLSADLYASGRTLYGFFPSPSQVTLESVMDTYRGIGQNAEVVLVQQPIDWQVFVQGVTGDSQRITDIHNQYVLAHQNGLEVVFIVDPLNGLNRTQFAGLPFGWKASFANPDVRAAFTNYTLRIVREFAPRYLGLASEINTYADRYPDDFPNYLSLYQEVYDRVKAEAPDTQVFVTFQWEDLNNVIPGVNEGRAAYAINWETVEAFEPRLDVWAISSYPFVAFDAASQIPPDYYTPLLTRTAKPLAVAEGGFPAVPKDGRPGSPQDQVDYLNALHAQIGDRLAFWIYLLYGDLDMESYTKMMRAQGQGGDTGTLAWFATIGLRGRPGLEVWNGFRGQK